MSASAGKVLLTPKGDFSTSATYSILDWVRYNGGVYVAKQTTTGNLPTDTTYWEKMIDSVSTLSGLSDVNITNIADGETLIWDATNSEWVNGTITGGGSYITLTTTTEQGENVSMSIGGATYTGTFSSEGICRFEGVKETGTATISTARVTTTLEIEYYGSYVAVVDYVPVHTYGVSWDGSSSPAWTRTDDSADFVDPTPAVNNGNGSSPFDDLMPWSGIEKIEDANAGTLVKIPKFWYKWTRGVIDMKLQISDAPQEGFYVSPAHADRGDGAGERDFVYVGAYKCANSTYKSTTGVMPQQGLSRATYRTAIHNLGSDIWQQDFAMFWTIRMLYLVEFAHWNSQEKIGYGCSNDGTTIAANGSCDSMVYHTGTSAVNRTTYGHTRYRYMEDLWGNYLECVDGIYFSGSSIYCIKNPSNFGVTGGTLVGNRESRNSPYNNIKTWSQPTEAGFEYALYPSSCVNNSSYNTYVCDGAFYSSEGVSLITSAGAQQTQSTGLFILQGNGTDTGNYCGSRLMKLPNAA